MWVREQEKEEKMTVLENGSLFISEVDRNDSGNYSCIKENVVNSDVRSTIHVSVRCK